MTTVPYYVYDLLEGSGYRWNYAARGGSVNPDGTPVTVTYAFQTSGTTPDGDTVVALTSSQQAAVLLALSYIEQLCDITFVASGSVGSADITFGFDETDTGASGEAAVTYWTTEDLRGTDVLTQANIYLDNVATNADLTPGTLTSASVADGTAEGGYGWMTLLHEIGHALGLKHPFDENDVDDPNSVLDTAYPSEDTRLYSVMSYSDGADSGYLDVSAQPYLIYNLEPRSYSMFDIAALQYLYGANTSPSLAALQAIFDVGSDTVTGAPGAFTYSFSPNTAIFETIADGGTDDTLNFASFTRACTIDLTPGSFSSLGMTVNVDPDDLVFDAPPSPFAAYGGTDALAIAFGTTVTTCIGGAGNDTIIGNDANDLLEGGPGINTIEGGSGINTAIYAGPRAAYSISIDGAVVHVVGPDDSDTLTNIRYLQFSNETIALGDLAYDFSGMGTSDILWHDSTTAELAMWGMDGASVTSEAVVAGGIPSGWSVAGVGDVNDDGLADLVWQDASTGQLAVWEMNGATATAEAVIGTVPLGWWVAGVGDFNGDGDADILFRNTVTGEVAIWEMDGFSILGSTAVGTAPAGWSVAGVGDFNGDGDADILWQNAASGQLSLWEMNGASVVSTATIGAAPTSWTVAGVGDFNGDGDADILFRDISTGQVAIWEMSGTNVLSYDTLAATMSSAWRVAEVGDFNGDGDADILWQNTTTGALTLWTMDGSTIASSQSAGNAGTGWQAGLSASPQAGGVPYDFFGDGTADILWQDSASGAVAVWQMDGSNVVGTSTLGSANGWQAVGVGDFSAYSGESILWQNSATDEMALWSVQGANVTSASVFASVPSGWQVAGVGDFFDAGTDDILWRNPTSGEAAIWEMNGTSVVSGTVIASGVDSAWKVGGVADFNGDGDADILWQNTATGAVAIWEMNGTSIAAATTIATPSADWQVAGVGDFAGNGTEDILLQNTTTDQLAVWQTNGTSVTGAAVIADDVPFAGGWQIAAVGDYTGSGADSILWQNPTTGQAALWQTNGATITATAIVATGIQPGWSVAHNPVLAA